VELANIETAAKACKTAADRWTDNVFAVKQYLVKKKGMNSKEVNKYLEIGDNFDYPELPPEKKRK
jgi:hypothetical protein